MVAILAALAAGYLLGSINSAVIVGRLRGVDIASQGSRSAGLTNTLRVLGKGPAMLVLAGDALKGIAACLVGLALGIHAGPGDSGDCLSLLAAGGGAVCGHNWPVYFGLRGGKGALTGIAVLFMIDWRMALLCLTLFAGVVAIWRYVSLGTICATLLFAGLSCLPAFGHGTAFQAFAVFMASIVIFRHRANLRRLLDGNENRLRFGPERL